MGHNSKIIDCTIRDGGLINNWDFSVEFVQDLYNGLSAAGVEYMEIGYKIHLSFFKQLSPTHGDFLTITFSKKLFLRKSSRSYLP